MKWIFYVLVFIYMFFRAVYGIKSITKETRSLSVDAIDYGPNKNYFEIGKRITIACKVAGKNQKAEWVDPAGNVVERDGKNRVFAQEHLVTHRTRVPVLFLIISRSAVEDRGVWTCRSAISEKEVSICVVEPASFVNPVTEVTADLGRSITLSCQAKGDPEPRLMWYRNEDIITDDFDPSKYQIMTKYNSQGFEGLLTITSLDSSDSGEYKCVAIQEDSLVSECSASIKMNITLLVNFPPAFPSGNTTVVTSEEDKSVELVCAAEGYPTPTYRWFEENGDIFIEYSKDDILLEDNGEKAVLTVIANASTFGHKYKCQATNQYGVVEKEYTLLKSKKPRAPDEIILDVAHNTTLHLIAKWDGDVLFTVDEIAVQYFKRSSFKKYSIPKEIEWKKAKENVVQTEQYDLINDEIKVIEVTLQDLDGGTEYWIRIRAMNGAGSSSWSKPVSVSTAETSEELTSTVDNSSDEDDDNKEPKTAAQLSDGTFYGVFFAGGIIVIAVGCMFAMRMV